MLSMKVPGAGAPKMGISGDKWIVRKCWDNDRFNRGITMCHVTHDYFPCSYYIVS